LGKSQDPILFPFIFSQTERKKEKKKKKKKSIFNPPRENQPQNLKCTGKTEEDREEKRRKNSPQKNFPILLVIWWLLWRF
jgi:hypothetical protein